MKAQFILVVVFCFKDVNDLLWTCVSGDACDVNSCEDVSYMAETLQPSYQHHNIEFHYMQICCDVADCLHRYNGAIPAIMNHK